MSLAQIITWLFIGLMAGVSARSIMRQEMRFAETLLAGLLGAVIGGYLFDQLDIGMPDFLEHNFTLGDIVVAFIGAVLLIILAQLIASRR
jgi:uncharacterized membrane protein YeaQ/YmgE (transglycosylase-associated protein family)